MKAGPTVPFIPFAEEPPPSSSSIHFQGKIDGTRSVEANDPPNEKIACLTDLTHPLFDTYSDLSLSSRANTPFKKERVHQNFINKTGF